MKLSIINKLIKYRTSGSKYFLTILSMFLGLTVFAQNTVAPKTDDSLSVFSNPLFIGLLCIIILLMIVISVLGGVLKNVAYATKEKSNNGKKILSIIAIVALLSSTKSAFAQGASAGVAVSGYMGLSSG